jgi:cellulose synthase/poly-beta-1,6-N-acetylglucosamine synthase-like glycosyltransferase
MVTLVEILLGGAALLLLLPVTVLSAEVLCAVTSRRVAEALEGERKRLTIVMPAHNEASIIAHTLRSLIPRLNKSDRLVVVADNCSDETARIAAAEGAEVIVRKDLTHLGKDYALEHSIRHLESDPPDIVMVIDADCRVAAGSIDRLVRLCARTARPVQALYLMHARKGAGLRMRIAEFAWVVKNQVRPVGLHRLGLPCQLMGTGTAFPWSCISSAKIANGHMSEDYKLGIDLARVGAAPLFCPEALVTSYFPASTEGALAQRTRWEHGHMMLILSAAPRLLVHALITLNADLMAMALDLCVPPLALLTLQLAAVWAATAVLYITTKAQFPLCIASAGGVLLALSMLLSWGRYARRVVSLGDLGLVIVYALWKIPLYVRFLVARQKVWLRSMRDDKLNNWLQEDHAMGPPRLRSGRGPHRRSRHRP